MFKFSLSLIVAALCSVIAFGQPQQETAQSHFEAGLRSLREKQFERSLASFEKSAALDAEQPATWANIGAVLIALKRYDRAESAFRSAVRLAPTDASFHTGLCQSLSQQRKHREALAACDEAVRLDPSSDRVRLARLIALEHSGHGVEDVRTAIDAAVGQFRNSEQILAFAADFYLIDGNHSHALALLESLTSLRPQAARYHGSMAEAYLYLGRDQEALTSARTALRLEPTNPFANYAMGLIFYELGQHEEAAESFGKISSEERKLKFASYYRAVSESRRGRKVVAINVLRDLTERYPDEILFQHELAKTLGEANRFADAELVYLKVNGMKEGNPEVIGGLAVSYMMQAKFEKAIPLFENLVTKRPDVEHYKMFLAVARGRQAITPRIPSMIREAEGDPKNIKIRVDLARSLAFANRIDEAQKYVDEIYALEPEDDRIFQILGVAFSEAGREGHALDAYKRSLARKENPSAYLGMAGIYSQRGEFDLASTAYSKVIELKPDTPNIMKIYADLLRDNGRRREALEMYKRSLALLPNNPPALFNAGLLSMKLGDRDSAHAYLGSLRTIDPKLGKQLARCLALPLWR